MRESTQPRSPYGVLIAAIFAVLFLLFVYSVADTLLLFFIAALFSLYLGGITDFFERRFHLPRRWGLLLGVLLTLVALVGIGYLIVPPVMQQTQGLISALPKLLSGWRQALAELGQRYPIVGQVLPPPDQTMQHVTSMVGNLGRYFSGLFPYLFGGITLLIHLFSVMVMAIYMTLRPRLYREGIVILVPPVHRDLARDILSDLSTTLRAWIVGQMLAMVFLGVLTWIGLMILGVQYSLAFGVFTGLVVVVPFFGSLASTLLPALFALGAGGPVQALGVVLLGVVIHLIEANFVHPIIMERQINLPPVLSILSVLIMAELLGAIGLLVAVPVLATVIVIVRRVYIHRLLEGRGFRRFVRDTAVEIRLPDSALLVHPSAAGLSIPALLERTGEVPR
ncbi:MAG: AI-2E family transporter [Gemmatimonadetes bacterium]|nr:AI-2E family transporter [Gemmatimonadota bacterium]